MDYKPEVVAWALGYGVFLAFAGSAVVAPPDPFTQLLVAGPLLVFVVPVIYLVLDADEVANHDVKSRRPLPYLVVVTLTSVLAAAVPLPMTDGLPTIVGRGIAFGGVFLVVSWVTMRVGTDRPGIVPKR